jgi:hypothetical protein
MGRGELACVYARQGRLEGAEKVTVETIKLVETRRGIAHPDCVFGMWKLAQLFALRSNRAKATEVCQMALERADMRITRIHPLGKLNSLRNTSSDPSDPADFDILPGKDSLQSGRETTDNSPRSLLSQRLKAPQTGPVDPSLQPRI